MSYTVKRLCDQELLKKLILIGCLIGFLFQSFQFLQIFLEYQTIMDISSEIPTDVNFPAVTLCSSETYRQTDERIWELLRSDNIPNLNLSDLRNGGFPLSTLVPISDPREELQYVTEYFDGLHGNCYTFNAAWSGRQVRKAFKKYFKNPQYAPTTESNRLLLLIYLPKEEFGMSQEALMTFHAPDVAPNVFNIPNKTSLMLEPPYQTNCTDYDKIGTTPARPGLLEENLCKMECLENATLAECGVIDYMVSPFTLESKLKMGRNVREGDSENRCGAKTVKNMNLRHYCEGFCRQPCRKITYSIDEESRIWPLPSEENQYTAILHEWISTINKTRNWTLNKDFISNEVLLVSIEHSKTESLVFKYYPTFQNIEIFSYFGGYLGMWVGYSISNTISFLFTFSSIYAKRCCKKHVKVENVENSVFHIEKSNEDVKSEY
ncbi:degenerin del-1-like isoform X2 [Tachypleus tridentatus]|uniref:degenerin del-1-like isoform X2 n=1 Tax=Tachypleus tridentatus TaxID=6853 RepID=UPI003FCF2BF5